MLQKCLLILVAVLGTAAVLLVCLIGLDPFSRLKGSPRWERRLLVAGLAALAALGWLPFLAGYQDETIHSAVRDPEKDRAVAAIAGMEKLLAAWPERPEAVRDRLQQAEQALEILPLVPPPGWVSHDSLLWEHSGGMRVTTARDPALTEKLRLRSRLERLAAEAYRRLSAETGELTDSADWQAVERAWRRTAPWSSTDILMVPGGTTSERRRAEYQLDLAAAAASRLEGAAQMLPAEAGLLLAEADRLRKNIYASPPDDVNIMCYRPAWVPAAKVSTERLGARLHLLAELAESGRVAEPVMEKVLDVVREDLAVLSAEQNLRDLPEEERDELPQLREEIARALEAIDASGRGAGTGRTAQKQTVAD
jgi:hypothetical protein